MTLYVDDCTVIREGAGAERSQHFRAIETATAVEPNTVIRSGTYSVLNLEENR